MTKQFLILSISAMNSYSSSSIVSILVLVTVLASPAHSAPCNSSCGSFANIGFPFSLKNSLYGVDRSSCPSSFMNNPYLNLFCNETEGKLYALHEDMNFTPLEVIHIHDDSLIVRIAADDMGLATMTSQASSCSDSPKTEILLPPVGTGPYIISDENKFGSFGCSLGTLELSDAIDYNVSDGFANYYDHVVVGGCAVLLPIDQNNTDCGNHTCCVATLPPVSDLHLRFAAYSADYSYYGTNTKAPECVCSNNYAALFHPESTDFDNRLYRIKITWALPVIINDTTSDPTSVGREAELNDAIMKSPNYACTSDETSDFIAVPEVQGYRCKCKEGFTGDGYANGTGCTSKIHRNIPDLIMLLIH